MFSRATKNVNKISKLPVGSPHWRVTRYGFVAFLRYLLHDVIFVKPSVSQALGKPLLDHSNFLEWLSQTRGIKLNAEEISLYVEEYCKRVKQKLSSPGVRESISKDLVSTKTRLTVLVTLLAAGTSRSYLETGTQHGTTASLVAQFDECTLEKIITLDVTRHELLHRESRVEYRVLEGNVRSDLLRVSDFNLSHPILFFHDSDHSYENMRWEINWAWRALHADFIVMDDIDGNNAFIEFAQSNGVKFVVCKFDTGPSVGVILR